MYVCVCVCARMCDLIYDFICNEVKFWLANDIQLYIPNRINSNILVTANIV